MALTTNFYQTISNEKMTAIIVIETNPKIKITSAQRSKPNVDFSNRIDKNENKALAIKSTQSMASALSIK